MVLIDKQSRVPAYEQIRNQLLTLILVGTFAPHSQLPSIRSIAADAGVNINTVKKSFSDLESYGAIYTVPGKGSFVSEKAFKNDSVHDTAVSGFRTPYRRLAPRTAKAGNHRHTRENLHSGGRIMIEVIGVTKRFQDFTAIKSLSLKVEKSSIYGLVGYNGAGKTTLLKTIAGVYRADEGGVKIFGENVFDNAKVKQRLFYVPDDIYFEPNATIESMGKFYAGYYPRFNFDTMHKLSKVFGLDTKKSIRGFSKGMQRQAEIILGMSTMPEVILLDESFDGLDPAKRNLIKICYSNIWRRRSARS